MAGGAAIDAQDEKGCTPLCDAALGDSNDTDLQSHEDVKKYSKVVRQQAARRLLTFSQIGLTRPCHRSVPLQPW